MPMKNQSDRRDRWVKQAIRFFVAILIVSKAHAPYRIKGSRFPGLKSFGKKILYSPERIELKLMSLLAINKIIPG